MRMRELKPSVFLLPFLAVSVMDVNGCRTTQYTKSGRSLRLMAVTHDTQTVYGFRAVDEPKSAATPAPKSAPGEPAR